MRCAFGDFCRSYSATNSSYVAHVAAWGAGEEVHTRADLHRQELHEVYTLIPVDVHRADQVVELLVVPLLRLSFERQHVQHLCPQ
jgi:hypothetical protein